MNLSNRFLDELWELRYAAAQFLLPDLEEACEDVLNTRLSRSNALLFLKKASMYKCDAFRRRALRILKNRYLQTLRSNEICGLEEADFVEVNVQWSLCVKPNKLHMVLMIYRYS